MAMRVITPDGFYCEPIGHASRVTHIAMDTDGTVRT